MLQLSRRIVNEWIKRYLDQGVDGLEAKKPRGREPYLTASQMNKLIQFIDKQSQSNTGGRLTGERIHHYISEQFKVTYTNPPKD